MKKFFFLLLPLMILVSCGGGDPETDLEGACDKCSDAAEHMISKIDQPFINCYPYDTMEKAIERINEDCVFPNNPEFAQELIGLIAENCAKGDFGEIPVCGIVFNNALSNSEHQPHDEFKLFDNLITVGFQISDTLVASLDFYAQEDGPGDEPIFKDILGGSYTSFTRNLTVHTFGTPYKYYVVADVKDPGGSSYSVPSLELEHSLWERNATIGRGISLQGNVISGFHLSVSNF